jgi:hypothetical protein
MTNEVFVYMYNLGQVDSGKFPSSPGFEWDGS